MHLPAFTHFDPNEALYDFNTIILKPKKKMFKTHREALRYMAVEEKRNAAKEYRFHPSVRRLIYTTNLQTSS